MFVELVRAFILIFVAEMGDKSQILAMSFASKYKVRNVIIGLSIGIFFNHVLAVLFGSMITDIFPLGNISLVAGLLFIVFGFYTLNEGEDLGEVKFTKYGPIITVAVAFFLGELGDKTQLTAIALASDASYPIFILVGTVLGMIFTSLIGIYIGNKFGSKIPEYTIKVLSSVVFVVFGLSKIYVNLPLEYLEVYYYVPVLTVLVVSYILFFMRYRKIFKSKDKTVYQETADKLKIYFSKVQKHLDTICLGEVHCGKCDGDECLLGYTKNVVKKALKGEDIDLSYLKNITIKSFDQSKVFEALDLTVSTLKNVWNNDHFSALHLIRKSLEMIIFGRIIEKDNYDSYVEELNIIKKVSS